MKIQRIIASVLALAALPAAGREENPFIKSEEGQKTPAKPPGTAYQTLVEYISVPAELLNPWLDAHPIKEDAAELRRQVQEWISGGQAGLIHTLFSAGTQHREMANDHIVEQIYPTEFIPGPPGRWMYPAAFETRNMGVSVTTFTGDDTAGRMEVETEWVNFEEPGSFYHPLMERTREPGDIFMPKFWSYSMGQIDEDRIPVSRDPFLPRGRSIPSRPSFVPGKIHLAGISNLPRQDESAPLASLLVFFRCALSPAAPAAEAVKVPEEFRVFSRRVDLPQAEFSAWLQTQETQAVAGAAWAALAAGKGTTTADLTAAGRRGARADILQVTEVIYPTEYAPPKNQEAEPEIFSSATAFETRNNGNTMMAMLSSDAQGLTLDVDCGQVRLLRNAVMRRAKDGNNWRPDMTMPIFASRSFHSTLRPEPGKWMLAASGPVYAATGQPEMEKVSLLFIKVD